MKERVEKIDGKEEIGECPKCGLSRIKLIEKVTILDPENKLAEADRVKYKYISICCNIIWSEKKPLHASFLAGRPDKLPEKEIHNSEVVGSCPKCKAQSIIWKERALVAGSLEHFHLVHTEVNDVYECPLCKHGWQELRYL